MRTHHTYRATLRSADDQALGHPPISAGTHGSSDLRLHPTTAGGDRDGCPGRRSPRVGNQDLSGEVERARVMYSTEPLGQRGFRRHSVSKAYTRTRLLLSPVRPCKAFANMRRYSCLFTKTVQACDEGPQPRGGDCRVQPLPAHHRQRWIRPRRARLEFRGGAGDETPKT